MSKEDKIIQVKHLSKRYQIGRVIRSIYDAKLYINLA